MLSQNPTARETKLAKALVHPDKAVRDRTFDTLAKHMSSVSGLSDKDWIKLWKALYYCMWLADKTEVQKELANSLANIASSLKSTELQAQYFRSFYRTMLREWMHLDQYRVNKFYVLFRVMLHKIFSLCGEQDWRPELVQQWVGLLEEEVLTKQPNGIRYHICDVFLEELSKAGGESVATSTFLLLVDGFFRTALRVEEESTFTERAFRSVLLKFLHDFAHDEAETTAETAGFPQVRLTAVQKKIFDLASAEDTPDRHRKRLYDLHKEFALKTGLRFVEDENAATEGESQQQKKTKKDKKKEQTTAAEAVPEKKTTTPAAAAAAVTTPVVAKKEEEEKEKKTDKKSKKRKNDEPAETATEAAKEEPKTVPAASAIPAAAEKTEAAKEKEEDGAAQKKKKSKKEPKQEDAVPAAAVPVPAAAQKEKKADKQQKEKEKAATPASSTPAAEATPAPAAQAKPEFVASKSFSGAREGYKFQKGPQGVGYYLDKNRPAKKASTGTKGKKQK